MQQEDPMDRVEVRTSTYSGVNVHVQKVLPKIGRISLNLGVNDYLQDRYVTTMVKYSQK